jgi:thioredoxin reductase (NADPH)
LDEPFDVVVVGGGIAGLTAALTSARLGRRTLVLTGDVAGGQLLSIEKVEGFPGFPDGVPGYDLCPMVQEQASSAGAEFMMTSVEHIAAQNGNWHLATGEGEVAARAAIIATGSKLKKLEIPGEEHLAGKGVSHCASCDAPLMRGRIVAVIGGGDSAMQEALTLAESVSKVIMLCRGAELKGQQIYRDRVSAHQKIDIRFGVVVTEILGEDVVSAVRTKNSIDGVSSDMEVAAVFPYVGLEPNTDFLVGVLRVDPNGVQTDNQGRTELIGLSAAGNVRAQSPRRAASAAGDGAAAAIAVDRYLADGSWRVKSSE